MTLNTKSIHTIILVCMLLYTSSGYAQKQAEPVSFSKEKIKAAIPQDWEMTDQQLENNDFYLYTSPDKKASFAVTTFEHETDANRVLNAFIANFQSKVPECIFISEPNLKQPNVYKVNGKTSKLSISIAAKQQDSGVILLYTLSTQDTPYESVLDKTMDTICHSRGF